MKRSEILFKTATHLAQPGAWGKGSGSNPPNGCDCIISGLIRVAPLVGAHDALLFVRRALGSDHIVMWNDAPERTQDEVVDLLNKAGALAEAEGA